MSVPVVEIENLVKRYQELVALDHFNLTIEEGEIFGLLGPNGSGKTTTINCILALLAFDKGTVRVFGREMRPDSYDLKRQIGVVMQNVAVFQELMKTLIISVVCISATKRSGASMWKRPSILSVSTISANFIRKSFPVVCCAV